ncbi:hypothetical protein BGW80DRAFT_1321186 [Lactifluus volemus]|nr:hypothetical protein BGW80DRAFT_1321186 [Lactifluus volemus]
MRVVVNQCECGGDHWQCPEGYEHKVFDSSRCLTLFTFQQNIQPLLINLIRCTFVYMI